MTTRVSHPIASILSHLVSLPTPAGLTAWWNLGSILGVCLVVQILTGVFLASHFIPSSLSAFESVVRISSDVSYGWLIRGVHANGASVFFLAAYLHLGRGLYYSSWRLSHVWLSGVTLLLVLMAVAFLGYVLPWGQMSFWGATVITNLISAVPYFGESVVIWLWGGFSVSGVTLTRFFAFHFILPFVLLFVVGVHLVSLHLTGSSSPLGVCSDYDKIPFHPYFTAKDSVGFLVVAALWASLALGDPWLLGDPENFLEANSLVTPIHIKPEWYFLFAYAILRSVPNKLGGVVALVLSVMIFYVLVLTPPRSLGVTNDPIKKSLFWMFITVVCMLTWIGGNAVEAPFVVLGQVLGVVYFAYFFVVMAMI